MSITRYIATALLVTSCLWPLLGRTSSPPGDLVFSQGLTGPSTMAARGSAVAMSSKWLLVGDPGTSGLLQHEGAAVLFRWGDHGWQLEHTYTLANLELSSNANARFGAAVAVSDDLILIGCPGCEGALHAVLVDVSDTSGSPQWYPVALPYHGGTYEMHPNVADPQLGTGSAVALVSGNLAVGAPLAWYLAPDEERGLVYAGHFDGSDVVWDASWAGENTGDRFGKAIALARTSVLGGSAGYYLLVGAPTYVNQGVLGLAGRAYLYKATVANYWGTTPIQYFANPNPGFSDALGSAVAFSRSTSITTGTVVLGAPGRVAHGVAGGSVRTYKASGGSDNFVFTQEDSLTDPATGDHFGSALALGSSRLLIGADGHQYSFGYGDGTAYLRDGSSGTWSNGQTLPPFSEADDRFGSAVALTSRAAVVGAPLHGTKGEGAVYFYLCDGIFSHNFDSSKAFVCAGP